MVLWTSTIINVDYIKSNYCQLTSTCAMEACLGLGRSQRNLNKQQQKELKQQQQQHTQLQQQKQATQQSIVTNQNYYTTQQQPQNQRHLVARGQTTNVAATTVLKQQQQQQQQQHLIQHLDNNSRLLLRHQEQNLLKQNVAHNTATTCTTTPKYRNTGAATTNMQQSSSSPSSIESVGGGGAGVGSQPVMSFQKSTVTVEVTTTLPSTISPTNTGSIVTNSNIKSFRKINRHQQQQQQQLLQQHQQQQQQHYQLQHQQQQMESDLDAIEVCADQEPMVSFKGGGLLRQTKTLGRLNHQHQHHHSIEDHHGQWSNMPQTTSLQLLQLQQQQQHDYSYAYYEPGAAMRHTNIPHTELMAGEEDLTPAPPNSMRALLSKGKKNKLLVSPATRQSYQTRLTQQQGHGAATASAHQTTANCSNISTPENFYEEISASSTSSSSNSMTSHHQLRATSHSAGSLTQTLVEEELRRVQNRHHKILGELNLSVEAMLMPDSPPNSSPTAKEPTVPSVSVTPASGQPLRLTSSSADNICDTALSGGPADDFISPIPNSATVSAGLLQSSCLAADLDSGFSGSSGASYIGSLRLHKTNALMSSRSTSQTTTTASTAAAAAAKTQQSAFAYATQSCRSFQRANAAATANTNVAVSGINTNASLASASASSTSSCTIKHLPQIHQNTKHNMPQQPLQQQQQQHSHLHHHHHLHNHHNAGITTCSSNTSSSSVSHQDDSTNSSGFFTRASCGRRILNCAKIRAAEDPGPMVVNAQPIESKARSFWNRKGWRKLPGFSTSTSSINDTGLSTVENK
ncbi:hypothetical protein CVS40_9552 [Lucilia cuprina]|nr:hypothetical protein CVS40_9552 [Lucilia cuprina]